MEERVIWIFLGLGLALGTCNIADHQGELAKQAERQTMIQCMEGGMGFDIRQARGSETVEGQEVAKEQLYLCERFARGGWWR